MTEVTERVCTHPVHPGSVCPSRRLWSTSCLTSLATGSFLCFCALCLPVLRNPSTLLLLGEPVSPLSASPQSSRASPAPWGFQIRKGLLSSSARWYTKNFPVSRRILGLHHPPLPKSAWGTAMGNLSSSLLKGQGLTPTSVSLGQLCGGQEILLGCLGPCLQASGSGDTSVTATNICVAICSLVLETRLKVVLICPGGTQGRRVPGTACQDQSVV